MILLLSTLIFHIGFFLENKTCFVLFSVPLEPFKVALQNKDSVLDSILDNGSFNVLITQI
jgi:hypothetical protein